MGDLNTGSVTFEHALLKSERLRIRIVPGAVVAILVVRTIRVFIVGVMKIFARG